MNSSTASSAARASHRFPCPANSGSGRAVRATPAWATRSSPSATIRRSSSSTPSATSGVCAELPRRCPHPGRHRRYRLLGGHARLGRTSQSVIYGKKFAVITGAGTGVGAAHRARPCQTRLARRPPRPPSRTARNRRRADSRRAGHSLRCRQCGRRCHPWAGACSPSSAASKCSSTPPVPMCRTRALEVLSLSRLP